MEQMTKFDAIEAIAFRLQEGPLEECERVITGYFVKIEDLLTVLD